jgi:acyl-coenzyme A synthetase/AMP-(fatty) acid ligase
VTALAGTHVCLRRVEAGAIFDAIERHGVTHLCGAPVVMNMLLNAGKEKLPRPVDMMTAGAAPPAAVIGGMERLGFRITHVYGLTEVYGPAVVCAWHDEWDALPDDERARLKARQGVRYPVLEAAVVARPDPDWGETPCAFVALKDGAGADAAEIIAFCRERLARFKAPRHVVFGPLPKTSTGKIQKFVLRERAKRVQ